MMYEKYETIIRHGSADLPQKTKRVSQETYNFEIVIKESRSYYLMI